MESDKRNIGRDPHIAPGVYYIDKELCARIDGDRIIVELRESEDERIRQWLIEECQKVIDMANPAYDTSKAKKAIAWLEKQKEQKPKEWNEKPCLTCDEYDKGYKQGYTEGCTAGYNKAMLEQPKQEWSEEDEKILVAISKALGCDTAEKILENEGVTLLMAAGFLASLRPQPKVEWSEDIIRKAVKEVGLTQHQIDWFKTNVFPPKQEWSEEDKRCLQELMQYIEQCVRIYGESQPAWQRWMNLLNSLRNRYMWRPSEEQMNSLSFGIHALEEEGYDASASEIKGLYEQLKKLMEEYDMAYFPAHCDHNCKGCQVNNCGWCGFLDIPVDGYDSDYNTSVYTDEDKYHNKEE